MIIFKSSKNQIYSTRKSFLHKGRRSYSVDSTKESNDHKLESSQRVRGMLDIFDPEKTKHNFLIDSARKICKLYGFNDMSTPIVEPLGLFQRSLGTGSDVVMKEMYRFEDLSGHPVVLRPENTAGVMRAVLEKYLTQMPQKCFYSGPMFRYERPQKGRLRQFHQIGVEAIGLTSPLADVEIIALAHHLLSKWKLADKIKLEINTLGDEESRNKYSDVLMKYFGGFHNLLSPDSVKRLERGNALRILDSKDIQDLGIIKNAPPFSNYLSAESKMRFRTVLDGLKVLEIPFEVNERLVRGLDYYCHTIFEFLFVGDKELLHPQQSTLIAGGRYDGLAKLLVPTTNVAGLGWAAGIERLTSVMDASLIAPSPRSIVVIAMRDKEEKTPSKVTWQAVKICEMLRQAGVAATCSFEGGVVKQLKKLTRNDISMAALFVGDELEQNIVPVKHLDTGEQVPVDVENLIEYCRKLQEAETNNKNNMA